MDPDERKRQVAELHARAERIRAGRQERADPSLRDTLERLAERVEDLGNLAADVDAIRRSLAVIGAAAADEEQPERRRHLRVVRDEERSAG